MDTTLLDPSLLSSSDYNSIRCFEEQQQTISQDHLHDLAEIYISNDMHHNYGVGILHRHVPLAGESVMVHSLCDSVEVCRAENSRSLDRHHVTPHSFFLNSKGLFQAYEYDLMTRQRSPPSECFLRQLRSFLVDNELTKLVAILPEDTRKDSVEFLLPDHQGMIYKEIDSVGSSSITGWKFCEDLDGTIRCIERQRCDPQEDGEHKVV